jgi:hypothetical protein
MIGDMFTDSEINSFASDLKGSTLDLIKQFSIDKIMDLSHYNSKNNKKNRLCLKYLYKLIKL